ncbi:MAG: transposase [Alphaproteobacteria bacterium]|jgi:putative transposase|nr:transposase [Alphaproteobacteria bacterium]
MARLPRIVIPGHPHHVTQRGNRGMQTFFSNADYGFYRDLLAEHCAAAGVAVWAYCLMPNHVHLILVPTDPDGLRRALGETHRRYTRRVNAREDWRGHLWQERFHSFVMDEDHLLACARYVERNPSRAKLVRRVRDWRWSSARAHLAGTDDGLVTVAPLLDLIGDWRAHLGAAPATEDATVAAIRSHARTGRPLGAATFIKQLEKLTGRALQRNKPGPKPGAGKNR